MFTSLFGVGDLDGAAFTKLVASLGVEAGRFVDPEVDAERLCIKDGPETFILSNMHAKFLSLSRRERLNYIKISVLARWERPDAVTDKRELVFPVLRDGAYLSIASLQFTQITKGAKASFAYREIAPQLFVQLMRDTPAKMLAIDTKMLEAEGASFDALYKDALQNLRARSQEPFIQIAPGVWEAPWRDSYTAARAQLPDVLRRVCDSPIIGIPNRDRLLVADMHHEGAYDRLVHLIDASDGGYPITTRIYELVGDELRLFRPLGESHATIAKHREMMSVEAQANYTKERALHTELGTDTFFPNLQIWRDNETKEVFTCATWTLGVGGVFPPVQKIAFLWLQDDKIKHSWEASWDVVEKAGLLRRTESPLARWESVDEPTLGWLTDNATQTK